MTTRLHRSDVRAGRSPDRWVCLFSARAASTAADPCSAG